MTPRERDLRSLASRHQGPAIVLELSWLASGRWCVSWSGGSCAALLPAGIGPGASRVEVAELATDVFTEHADPLPDTTAWCRFDNAPIPPWLADHLDDGW